MDPLANPVVLMTRPKAGANRFLMALAQLTTAFRAVISPAFELEAVPTPERPFAAAVFTSASGVAHAPKGAGRTAWCVGDSTARAAAAAGYNTVSAGGAAEDLVKLILERKPQGELIHFRGEISKGNVSEALGGAGILCTDSIVYRKAPQGPTPDAISVLSSGEALILPLFSAETVTIIAGWQADFSRCHAVAISQDVAETAEKLAPRSIAVSAHPDQDSMARLIAGMIA